MLRCLLGIGLIIAMYFSTSAKQVENSDKGKVLCFHKGHVDTVLLVDSTSTKYLVQPLTEKGPTTYEIKKKQIFFIPAFALGSSWVKVRYEDDFLVDDVFISAKVMGYNEDYLLIKFDADQTKDTVSVHKSQVAVKDLKRLNLYKK